MKTIPGKSPRRVRRRIVATAACPRPAAALGLAIVLTLSAAVLSCTQNSRAGDGQARPAELREYQGQKLDPVSKFRENSIVGPQKVDIAKYRLRIAGLVDKPMTYAYDDVLAHEKISKVVTLHCVEGWEVKALWEGVLLRTLLAEAGVKPEAKTVIFKCHDGYTTSVPVAYANGKDALLAFKINGLVLPPDRGYPFALLTEDKWGYKNARWVTTIELSGDANYRGYWEERGYNNNGDLAGPIYERRP